MAVTNVQTSGELFTTSGGVLTWTPTTTLTVNNLLTARMWSYQGSPTAPHDASGTPKVLSSDALAQVGSNGAAYIDSLIIPSGVTSPLTSRTGASYKYTVFDEWAGCATSAVLDQTSNTGLGTPTGSINTGANAGLALAVLENTFGSATTSTGTSWVTDITEGATTVNGAACSRLVNVASQTGLNETWSGMTNSADTCSVIASYNAAAVVSTLPLLPPPVRFMYVR